MEEEKRMEALSKSQEENVRFKKYMFGGWSFILSGKKQQRERIEASPPQSRRVPILQQKQGDNKNLR